MRLNYGLFPKNYYLCLLILVISWRAYRLVSQNSKNQKNNQEE